MCGIFAFHGRAPDPTVIHAAATRAAQRGPHAHGWASPATATHHRALGRLNPEHASMALTATFLGHARMATVGVPTNADAVQPVAVDGHHVAYNGTIPNPSDVHPAPAPSDTVAFARAYATLRAEGRTPHDTVATLLNRAQHHHHALVVLDANGTMTTHTNQLPLWTLDTPEGTYLSSGRFHPDTVRTPDLIIRTHHTDEVPTP